jgi:hypothetical protein
MLSRLVYFSERACGDDELRAVMAAAAPRNKARHVTGLLMADEIAFIQILEGPRGAVSALFQEIARDPRHRELTLVEMTEIAAPSYPAWGMAHVSDPSKVDAAWKRVMRVRASPCALSVLQLRGLLKIALGDAIVPAPAAAVA